MLPRDLLRDSGLEELRLQLANSVARTILACVILRSTAHFTNYGNHSRQPLFFYRHESRIRSNTSRMVRCLWNNITEFVKGIWYIAISLEP